MVAHPRWGTRRRTCLGRPHWKPSDVAGKVRYTGGACPPWRISMPLLQVSGMSAAALSVLSALKPLNQGHTGEQWRANKTVLRERRERSEIDWASFGPPSCHFNRSLYFVHAPSLGHLSFALSNDVCAACPCFRSPLRWLTSV